MLLCAGILVHMQAQDSTKQSMKDILDSKHFEFEPISMTTAHGKFRHVDGGYFLLINGDTLKTYLPYIGRAYNASFGSSEAGFDFTSTDYTYTVSEGKKKKYTVEAKTKDRMYNAEFTLTVYDDGTAYLRAYSSDREAVSYNGSVKMK